jgi:hypothetical protein
MPKHLPPRRRSARTCAPGAVLLVLLALALASAAPATAAGKPARVPNCTGFPLAKMALLIHVSSLGEPQANPLTKACFYQAPVPGHYSDLLAVSVRATSKRVFLRAQAQEKTAPGVYGIVKIRGATAFDVVHTVSGATLNPCPPGHTLPEFGPPLCNGDPEWSTVAVDAYGTIKPRGPKALVSVTLAGQEEVTLLSYAVSLDRQILSGKIR